MTLPTEGIPEDPSRSGQETGPNRSGRQGRAAGPDTARPSASLPASADTLSLSADPLSASADAAAPVQPDSPGGGAAGDRWSEIQATFVDDPRRSVTEAAGMVDAAISGFIDAVRERQESLASLWQDQGAGTEELRVALQEYRTFWTSVAELPQPA
jgi:hypothetical protein